MLFFLSVVFLLRYARTHVPVFPGANLWHVAVLSVVVVSWESVITSALNVPGTEIVADRTLHVEEEHVGNVFVDERVEFLRQQEEKKITIRRKCVVYSSIFLFWSYNEEQAISVLVYIVQSLKYEYVLSSFDC